MQKKIKISAEIFSKYPEIAIGYMVVENLHHVASAKLGSNIKEIALKGIKEDNLNLQNLVDQPTITFWRSIYQDCGVKPKTYKSSIESLLRRFIQNDYKEIIPIVDLYNYLSAGFILSAGGYNEEAIEGDISLRFAKSGDRFIPLNGKEDIPINYNHIIYADDNAEAPVICWMWNHKDCRRTMLTNQVTKGLFIFDCILKDDVNKLNEAIKLFTENLTLFGATVSKIGILTKENQSGFL